MAVNLRSFGFDGERNLSMIEGERTVLDHLKELHSISELDQALDESLERPVLLFKHSLTCPTSTTAFNELQSYLNHGESRISYRLIIVQRSRVVSDELASRLQLKHQSPQAVLVRNGREVWSASHFDITAAALEGAIRSAVDSAS